MARPPDVADLHLNYRAKHRRAEAFRRHRRAVPIRLSAALRRSCHPGTSLLSTSSSIAALRGRRASSARESWRTCQWRIRFGGRLGNALHAAASELALPVTRGGTYLVMEGPQFSTKAESELYRSWGCDVIGMTNMPEAKLAREAELCYATVAMVTDFDCWHPDHDHVTVDAVVRILLRNADRARDLVRTIVPTLGAQRDPCPCGCDRALDHAIITAPDRRDAVLAAKLDAVASRVL